jgi:hypothetical protein
MPSMAGTSGCGTAEAATPRSRLAALGLAVGLLAACSLPRGHAWDGGTARPDEGSRLECGGDPADDFECAVRDGAEMLRRCQVDGEFFRIDERDCTAEGLVCVDVPPYDDCRRLRRDADAEPIGCAVCRPCAQACVRNNVSRCRPDGSGWDVIEYCDTGRGEVCAEGRCGNGCDLAELYASNVGCEYYAVDLDNAVVSSGSAAAQQFAVVVSNPSPLQAQVRIERCLSQPCEEEANREVVPWNGEDDVVVNPDDLETFLLDPAEVDGSPDGTFDEGTHTAITHRAYRITSSAPIVVYQFNPYDNRVNVFSNDASLLIPVTALGERYTVLGWPQTIAYTPANPDTNMAIDLRAFLTIVGTRPGTRVRIRLTADVVPSGEEEEPIPRVHDGETLEVELGAFEVLNLESGYWHGRASFMADFTGTVVESSAPVAVFSGSEASDVPIFEDLSTRQCCGDHLEEQLPPDRTLGFTYVVPHTPRRSEAVAAAGGDVTPAESEPEWFRVLAVEDDTLVTTTVAGHSEFRIQAGQSVIIESSASFTLRATRPVALGQFVGSQWTTGMVGSDPPGGDPAFILVPPIEQWRRSYVFLTPERYAFDYALVMVSRSQISQVTFDGEPITARAGCSRSRADGLRIDDPSQPDYYIVTCALSQPVVLPGVPRPDNVLEGIQEDGVHEVRLEGSGSGGLGLVVYGFDSYVSYGYPGGTDLRALQ